MRELQLQRKWSNSPASLRSAGDLKGLKKTYRAPRASGKERKKEKQKKP